MRITFRKLRTQNIFNDLKPFETEKNVCLEAVLIRLRRTKWSFPAFPARSKEVRLRFLRPLGHPSLNFDVWQKRLEEKHNPADIKSVDIAIRHQILASKKKLKIWRAKEILYNMFALSTCQLYTFLKNLSKWIIVNPDFSTICPLFSNECLFCVWAIFSMCVRIFRFCCRRAYLKLARLKARKKTWVESEGLTISIIISV